MYNCTPGSVGVDLEDAARDRVLDASRELRRASCAAVEHEVVVVAAADRDLRVAPSRIRAPIAVGCLKSNGVPATGSQLAGRDERGVDRRVALGVDHEHVVENARRGPSGQVEVGCGWSG